jgi:hypothetical protein
LSLVVNFQFFNSHFPVTALGLDLFSRTYGAQRLKITQSKRSTRLGASFALKQTHGWLPKRCASLKIYTMDKVPKKEIVSVYFSCAVFSLLVFLTPEGGTQEVIQKHL